MKKIRILLFFLFGIFFLGIVNAESYLNFGQVMKKYFDYVGQGIPESYKYIQLNYTNLDKNSELYSSFQKGVYMDLFPNTYSSLPLSSQATQKIFSNFVQKYFYIDSSLVSNNYITQTWLDSFLKSLEVENSQTYQESNSEQFEGQVQKDIMEHAYKVLKEKFIEPEKINDEKLRYGAIQGMVKAVGEDYTVYFPPSDAKNFNDEIQGDFEGIGAMVEMKSPGVLIIVSPLKDSPAQKAGLLPGDQIKKVNDNIVTEETDANTAVSWIKGPAGTFIILTVKRGDQELEISVIRSKIVLKNIESEIFQSSNGNVCYVGIRMFGTTVSSEFDTAMENLSTKNCIKYIFDLRNNPGGLLDQVSEMLNYFVPTGNPVAVVKSKYFTEEILAKDVDLTKITNGKKIIVLINKGSASASEIFAGTIKDYYPDTTLVGEKSFGKGSVQELVEYKDGSILKYTMAKRYTGKTQKGIDKIGITPDAKIVDKTGTLLDEPLEFAKLFFKK